MSEVVDFDAAYLKRHNERIRARAGGGAICEYEAAFCAELAAYDLAARDIRAGAATITRAIAYLS